MHDSKKVFDQLNLMDGQAFLDLGCGAGDYSLCAARQIGQSGHVYALDLLENTLNELKNEAVSEGLNNVHTMVADIFKPIAIPDKSVDVCMLATVLHSENVLEKTRILFSEIKRVLKPGGRLAIIECKKEKMPFGPPVEFRVAPHELESNLYLYDFRMVNYTDLGYNYMIMFSPD